MPRERTREQELRAAIQHSGLPDGEIRLFIVLLDKAEWNTAIMNPVFALTLKRLAELCARHPATVWRRLGHLETDGWAMPPDDSKIRRGPGAKVVRNLCVGRHCEHPRWGGARKRASHLEPESVASCTQRASHLDTEKRRILNDISAGQAPVSAMGQRWGRDGEKECANPDEKWFAAHRFPESWSMWPENTIGAEVNEGIR